MTAGWFGKMPYLGDFASRRLPDEFIRGWDDWLQRGLAAMHAELGADWLARYLVAPVRRFWLAPGLLGDSGWAGVLMPSVDSVGRHFPLTIAQHAASLDAMLAAGDWFRAVDAAARKVLDVEFSVDDLEHELAQVPPLPMAWTGEAAITPPPGSAWWCGEAVDPLQFECFAALPPATAFAALLETPT
ncbi:MAG TPA: type VI secretion system-associated protein TagF [Albitalea sp.]|nr:type VI secretion system-associated protein TagF [Albitalea sp.]